jgi:hypothetical protein
MVYLICQPSVDSVQSLIILAKCPDGSGICKSLSGEPTTDRPLESQPENDHDYRKSYLHLSPWQIVVTHHLNALHIHLSTSAFHSANIW